MDNRFTRLDSYGRIICVPIEVPPEATGFKQPEINEHTEIYEPMTPCETWARAERMQQLENLLGKVQTVVDRLNQRVEFIEYQRGNEIQPLNHYEFLERVKRFEDTVIMLTDRMKRAEDKVAALHLANISITGALSELSVKLYKIYELVFDHDMGDEDPESPEPRERVCESCKWGTSNDYKEVDCHYEPQDVSHTPTWYCSKWEEE